MTWTTPAAPETLANVQLWENVWKLGGPSGVFHAVADFHLIKRYCELIERREMFIEQLGDSWTDVGSTGQVILHPLARALDSVEAKLVPIEDRLGLNPQARHTIQIGAADAEYAGSQLSQWLKKQDA